MYLSAANGEPTEMVAETLQLGIHLLSGGNKDIQKVAFGFTVYLSPFIGLFIIDQPDRSRPNFDLIFFCPEIFSQFFDCTKIC